MALLVSLIGVFLDRAKAFAIVGLVLAGIPCVFAGLGILMMLVGTLTSVSGP